MAPAEDSKKRRADGSAQGESRRKRHKKSKSNQSKNRSANDESHLDVEAGLNRAVADMDPLLLTDMMAQKSKRFGLDLSDVEMGDLRRSLNDTSQVFTEPRTLDNLPAFLETVAGREDELKKAPRQNGAPHTIVVAGAGLRAADIVR